MAKLTDRTELTTPADGDLYVTTDVSDTTDAATGTDKKITWANFKAGLKTYFDTLYAAALGADDNYVTDAEKVKLSNLSGTNTGDQTSIVGITGTMAQFDTAVSDGNIVYQSQALGTPSSGTVTNLTGTASININGTVGATTPTTATFTTATADRVDYDRAVGLVNAIGNLGATETIDWSTHTHFTGTLDSNITFTYSNNVSGQTITLYLSYDGTAQRTITWPTTTWLDNATGAAPTTPAASGKILVVTLAYIGTTVYGSATGNYAVYA